MEDEGIKIDTRTIGKIIKKEDLTRKYRIREIKYKYVKIPLKIGELVLLLLKYNLLKQIMVSVLQQIHRTFKEF